MDNGELHPRPSADLLKQRFVGKDLRNASIPIPSAILDVAVVRRHCQQMLHACEALKLSFRAHVKTHKTVELARLQVGAANKHVRFVVSTLAEIEILLPYLRECRESGGSVDVLVGLPMTMTHLVRLIGFVPALDPKDLSIMIDHRDHLNLASRFRDATGAPLRVFLKVDTGYHRAGLTGGSQEIAELMKECIEMQQLGVLRVIGLYSHTGHSYAVDTLEAARNLLITELQGLQEVARMWDSIASSSCPASKSNFILSIGASPTAVRINDLMVAREGRLPASLDRLSQEIEAAHQTCEVEIHAGVYPLQDLQQLATRSETVADQAQVDWLAPATQDIAITILTELSSTYFHRSPPEALITAGTLSLGREPCKEYSGWGIVFEWRVEQDKHPPLMRVSKISQEHALISPFKDDLSEYDGFKQSLSYGKRLRIWPNHACIAAAMFDWFLIVDREREDAPDTICDVWVRARGW